MPKNIICTECGSMKTLLGRCVKCNPPEYFKPLPPKKKPKYTKAKYATEKNYRHLRKLQAFWDAVLLLMQVDELLEVDRTGEIVMYADKQALAAEIKNKIMPMLLHICSIHRASRVVETVESGITLRTSKQSVDALIQIMDYLKKNGPSLPKRGNGRPKKQL